MNPEQRRELRAAVAALTPEELAEFLRIVVDLMVAEDVGQNLLKSLSPEEVDAVVDVLLQNQKGIA
jgi:predicted kinase